MNAGYGSKIEHEYGNTVRELRRAVIMGLAIGLFGAIAGIVGTYFERGLDASAAWIALELLLMPAAIMTLVILPTLLFHIQLSDGQVRHVFLGRYVLSEYPISDFVEACQNRHGCSLVLYFTGGRRIHFFGAHLGEIARLTADLSQPNSR